MRTKKGVATTVMQDILVGLVAGAFFAVILFFAIQAFSSLVPKTGPLADCSNDFFWDDKRGLESLLRDVDKGEYAEFLFFNDNCKIVSFSFVQGIGEIQYVYGLPREPLLCLCSIEGDICKPYDCFKFKDYEQINTKQFSTGDLENYVVLKFTKDGKILRVDAIGTEKSPEPITYTKNTIDIKTDPAGLVNSLAILFETRSIESFTPIIQIKEQGFLLPQNIPNIDGFIMFFDLELALPRLAGQTEEDYLLIHQTIDPEIVKKAFLEISIAKNKFNSLTELQKENVLLYYKKDTEWLSSNITCIEKTDEVLCGGILNEFSTNFAISTITNIQNQNE